MKVKDVMIQDVYKVRRDATVKAVLELFSERRISGVPIVDESDHVIGYISDGDIMRHLATRVPIGRHPFVDALTYYYGVNIEDAASGGNISPDEFREQVEAASTTSALEVGGHSVRTIHEDSELADVVQMLAKENIKKVPVVRKDVLVGIVSRGDVVRTIVHRVLSL
ncbi:MAG: CBS domain-containing protein [Firmicutes bacterium]|nr:CBS domain-containing protein [Bacillota bacterium]